MLIKKTQRIQAIAEPSEIRVSITGLTPDEADRLYHFCRMFGYKASSTTQGTPEFGHEMSAIANKIQNALFKIIRKE
jgi:hypothetical protein